MVQGWCPHPRGRPRQGRQGQRRHFPPRVRQDGRRGQRELGRHRQEPPRRDVAVLPVSFYTVSNSF